MGFLSLDGGPRRPSPHPRGRETLLRHHTAVVLLALAMTGCLPNLDTDLSRVDRATVLAVRATPAEAAPGATFELEALFVDADGPLDASGIAWSLCTARRPLAELGPVASDCATGREDVLEAIGVGATVTATMPADACRRFGPEPPMNTDGQSNGRPVDPDATGGYAQPVILKVPDASPRTTLYGTRITCGLAGAKQEQSAEYRMRHRPNASPALDVVRVRIDGGAPVDIDVTQPLSVSRGAEVDVTVGWPGCPALCTDDCAEAVDCAGAEPYLYFDPISLKLRERTEAISLAWYATAGAWDDERTGRAEGGPSWSHNVWIAPEELGEAFLWIVIRDDRGGTSWTQLQVAIAE